MTGPKYKIKNFYDLTPKGMKEMVFFTKNFLVGIQKEYFQSKAEFVLMKADVCKNEKVNHIFGRDPHEI